LEDRPGLLERVLLEGLAVFFHFRGIRKIVEGINPDREVFEQLLQLDNLTRVMTGHNYFHSFRSLCFPFRSEISSD